MSGDLKILTHISTQASPTWEEKTTLIQAKPGTLNSFFLSLRLYLKRKDFDLVVISGGKAGVFFSLLQALLPFKKTPTLMLDCLWYRAKNSWKRFLKRTQIKLMNRSVNLFLVWAKREIEAYSSEFGIPQEKLRFFPYHTTCEVYDCTVEKGDYLFSGGNWNRDYKTLIEAVKGLKLKVILATNNNFLLEGISLPENAKVISASDSQFYDLLAKSKMVVVPMAKGFLHSGGQQTFLNAMFWGKPVIVTDPEGANDYIQDKKDGILVQPGDVVVLRNAISYILENPEMVQKMVDEAQRKTRQMTTEKFFQGIIELAQEIVYGNN
ncbi:MAG TPA: glycosyltransferase [Terriglobales bacterium]|nr:glycosyltransferase [Terriglobales bacterium]